MFAFKHFAKKYSFFFFGFLLFLTSQAQSQNTQAKVDYFQLPFFQVKESRVEDSRELELDAKNVEDDIFVIETDPDGCVLWIDGRRISGNPLRVTRLEPGTYTYRIERNNYKTFYGSIVIKRGFRYEYEVSMELERAYLKVAANKPIEQVLVNGKLMDEPFFSEYYEIFPGRSLVTVRSFAYRDQSVEVYLEQDHVASVYLELEPAPFDASILAPSRIRFRPENLGRLGTSNLRFEVDAPGEAKLELYDQNGSIAWTAQKSGFDTWIQEIEWNGRDSQGRRLEDGEYRYQIYLKPDPGVTGEELLLKGSVTIDSSSFLKHRSQNSLYSGSSLVNDSYVLEAGAVQAAFGFLLSPLGDELNQSFATSLSASARLGIDNDIELAAGLMLESAYEGTETNYGGSEPDIMIASQIKWAYAAPRYNQALSGSVQLFMAYLLDQDKLFPFGSDVFARSPGFRLSNTLQLEDEGFFTILELGFFVSPYRSIARQIDWNVGVLGGLSIGLDLDWLYLALSASVQTRGIDEWASLGLVDQGIRFGLNAGLADESGFNIFFGTGFMLDFVLLALENTALWRPFFELSIGFLD